ncbi:MAG: hypothetical protein V7641_2897 [Blastocatellia bacterium]
MGSEAVSSGETTTNGGVWASGLTTGLRACGFFYFVFGVIAAFYMWGNAPSSPSSASTFYIGMAIGILFQSVLFWLIILVLADTADHTRAISERLLNDAQESDSNAPVEIQTKNTAK